MCRRDQPATWMMKKKLAGRGHNFEIVYMHIRVIPCTGRLAKQQARSMYGKTSSAFCLVHAWLIRRQRVPRNHESTHRRALDPATLATGRGSVACCHTCTVLANHNGKNICEVFICFDQASKSQRQKVYVKFLYASIITREKQGKTTTLYVCSNKAL